VGLLRDSSAGLLVERNQYELEWMMALTVNKRQIKLVVLVVHSRKEKMEEEISEENERENERENEKVNEKVNEKW